MEGDVGELVVFIDRHRAKPRHVMPLGRTLAAGMLGVSVTFEELVTLRFSDAIVGANVLAVGFVAAEIAQWHG